MFRNGETSFFKEEITLHHDRHNTIQSKTKIQEESMEFPNISKENSLNGDPLQVEKSMSMTIMIISTIFRTSRK